MTQSATNSSPASAIPATGTRFAPAPPNNCMKSASGTVSRSSSMRIADVLHRCGTARCFRSITDSGIVGYEKPHPEIFRQSMKSMNATPEESLYVGDVYSVDYLGATGAGMQALLMDVPGAYRDKGVPRVESLAELQTVLHGGESTGS